MCPFTHKTFLFICSKQCSKQNTDMKTIDVNINTIVMIGLIFLFIIAMSLIGLAFYVFKKTFECIDETNFGVQNRLIGKIWHIKKPTDPKSRASP